MIKIVIFIALLYVLPLVLTLIYAVKKHKGRGSYSTSFRIGVALWAFCPVANLIPAIMMIAEFATSLEEKLK